MWLNRGPWICHRLKREDLLVVRCWRRRDAAGRSSLLLADPAGVDAGAVAEGRKCWRRLFTVAVKGEVVVGSVWD